ncbi:MAG: hypothetical protein GY888_31870, partial [Planctomycetaceae bacterium]|nr:hypothetical protein [Planctomycetaceae bacterium]
SVTLLTSVNAPTGITTDGNQVYWIDSAQQGNPVLLRRDRAQASNEILYPRFESDTQLVNPVDLEVISTSDQGTQLAILDGNGGRLWKLLATQTSNTITAIGAARYTAGSDRSHRAYLALDENNAYVADPGLDGFGDTAATIESIPLAGGSWQSLYTGTLAADSRGVSVHAESVYYSRGNEIYQLPTTGADPTLLVSDDRFGYLGGLWFENNTLYAVDTINMAQAVSWEISFGSNYAPNANKGWTVTPEAGEEITNLDFGNIDAASLGGASSDSRITGRVYQDANGNGQLDSGETGLAGITLFLDLNNNGNLDEGEPTQVTLADNALTTDEDEAGLYAFSSLGAGTYSVTPVVPEGLKQIGPLETQFATSSLPVPDGPRTTASGDFNGDGLPDLVVGSGNSNQVSVLLNLGQGSFSEPVNYTTGVGPSDIAVADLDGDGQLDLLVSNLYAASVSILKGNANGTFT